MKQHPPRLQVNQNRPTKHPSPRYQQCCSPTRNRQNSQYSLQQVVDTFGNMCTKLMRLLDSHCQRIASLERNASTAIVDRLDRLIEINLEATRNSRVIVTEGRKDRMERGMMSSQVTAVEKEDNNVGKGVISSLEIILASKPSSQCEQPKEIRQIKTVVSKEQPIQEQPPQLLTVTKSEIISKELASALIYLTQTPMQHLIKKLKRKMGQTYESLASRLYDYYSSGRISYRDMKMQFAQGVIDLNYQLQQQMYSEHELNQLQKVQITAQLDKASRNILQFLMSKYPQSRSKIIDTEISAKIQHVAKNLDPKYDMLANAGMKFQTDKPDYTFQIKKWVNKLIAETKEQFPKFKETVKEIFVGEGDCTTEVQHQSLEYEIGSKISLTTELYTDQQLKQPRLDLKTPQLLRILMKWANQLYGIMMQPAERILQNKFNFKSIIGSASMSVALTRKRRQKLINKLNNIYLNNVLPSKSTRETYMHRLINDVFVLARAGFKDYDELNTRQVSNVKISQYLRQCAETYCLKMLNNFIRALNSVRSKYRDGTLESSIDLVTFGVMDLLRCRCVTTKRELLRIYNQVVKRTDYFEIIRVKNKLNQSTRDIFLILKIKNSFMICEMQLALGDFKDEINDHFCHNLYELHRSAFPILFQTANQLVSLDYRMTFFQKSKHPIIFYSSTQMSRNKQGIQISDGTIYCRMNHNKQPLVYVVNDIPFCCSHCSAFMNAFSSCLEFVRCPKCMVAICPRCIVETYPTMFQGYLARYIDYQRWSEYVQAKPYYAGFCGNLQLEEKVMEALEVSEYVFVFQFDRQGPKVRTLKKYRDHIVPAFYTLSVPPTKIIDSPLNWCILVLPTTFQTISLSNLYYYQKCNIGVSWQDLDDLLENNSISKVIATLNVNEKQALIIDIVESDEEMNRKRLHDMNVARVVSQAAKAHAIVELTGCRLKNLGILRYLPNQMSLVNLNMWENQLTTVRELREYTQLQELNLRENLLQTFDGMLNLTELQSLNLHQNRLSGSLPVLNFPSLKFLDLSDNHLNDLSNLSQSPLPNLKVMIVSINCLHQLPTLILPQLQILYFVNNNISNLKNLSKSHIPKLRRLQGSNNRIQGQLPTLNLPMLEQLLLPDNQLTGIQRLAGSTLYCLDILDLSNNHIVGPLPILTLPKIQKLYLSNNSLTSIDCISSWDLPMIHTLDLSTNGIVGELPVFKLPHLCELNLDNNHVVGMQNLMVSCLDSLQILTLRNNKLTSLPMLRHRKLKRILLEGNSIISCAVLQMWKVPELELIDLSHNCLSDQIPILFMPSLQILLLDYNNVTGLRCMAEKQLIPSIQNISLDGNPLAVGNRRRRVEGEGQGEEDGMKLRVVQVKSQEDASSISNTNRYSDG